MNRLRFIGKSLVHGTIDWSGRPRRLRRQLRGKLIILTYHSFSTDWPRGLVNSLPIKRFEKQILFLKMHYRLVSLQEGLENLSKGYVDDKPWVAITIDDGFQNNHTYAWPVLQHYKAPATIFIATDFIDTGRQPWPTQLVEILERTGLQEMNKPFESGLRNFSERFAVAKRLKKNWCSLLPDQRFEKLHRLRQHLKVTEESRYPGLTWEQIRQMQEKYVSFGSHTVFHSILSEMEKNVTLLEMQESKARLENELQKPCELFAYPDGKYDDTAKEVLKMCGYKGAVTQDFGVNSADDDYLGLKRIEIPFDDPLPSFRSRVSTALS